MRFTAVITLLFSLSAPAWAQMTPPARPGSVKMLRNLMGKIDTAYRAKERPVVVFDVDGTLLDNRPRIMQILVEFSKQKSYVTADAARKLQGLTIDMIQYRLNDTLARVNVTDQAVVNNAAAYWGERFFNQDYLKYDAPTPGSVDCVRMMYSKGARIVYLTGRDVQRQFNGTARALWEKGFPIGIQNTELIMKPNKGQQDAIFKQRVTQYLRNSGKVVATFDNEPANANVYRRAFSDAKVVLFEASHSPNPPPLLPQITSLDQFSCR